MATEESFGKRLRAARLKMDLTQLDLAKRCGWESNSRISNYEQDLREPTSDDVKKLGDVLGVAAGELQFGKNQGLGLSDYNVAEGPALVRRVPLISWVQAGNWNEIVDNFHAGDADDWLPTPKRCGPRTFALHVQGASMEPKYHQGEIIFVDPDVQPVNGSRVIVRLENEKEATFKQLVIEGEKRYLKALNPAWPEPFIKIDGDATICGVVIGKWTPE